MAASKIFITNHCSLAGRLARQLEPQGAFYICLDCNPDPGTKALLDSLGIKNLTEEAFSGEPHFRSEYTSFLRNLNKENSSLRWWAMNFTNKVSEVKNLYKKTFYTLALINLVKNMSFKNLFAFCSNRNIAKKMKLLEKDLGVEVNFAISHKPSLKAVLIQNSPMMIFYSAAKALSRKLLYLAVNKGAVLDRAVDKNYLIVTQFEDRSFKDSSFEDLYFKSLKDFLSSRNINVLTAGFVMCKFKKLFQNTQPNVFAFEKFLKISDIFSCLLQSLKLYLRMPKPKGILPISGIDTADLVKNEIKLSINRGECFSNLTVYFAAFNLLQKYRPHKLIYPFENRSWEKMLILAARKVSSDIRLVGYQHASINARHLTFYLEEEEYREIPFPDDIITTGCITRDIMSSLLRVPPERLKAGCALRQSLPSSNTNRPLPKKIYSILVVLTMSADEDARALEFLDAAFADSQPYKLTLRPHPCIDFKEVLRLYEPRHIKYELDAGPLYRALNSSDLLLYASSTVSLEAISAGIPVIFLALTQGLSPDPLFDLPYLRWVCSDPKQLKEIIDAISNMDRDAFLDSQKKAQEFIHSYFISATEDTMKVFL